MNTFFTPVESPTHSDDEDIPRKQGDSRKLSRSNELFMFLAKLTPDKVSKIIFFYINRSLICASIKGKINLYFNFNCLIIIAINIYTINILMI